MDDRADLIGFRHVGTRPGISRTRAKTDKRYGKKTSPRQAPGQPDPAACEADILTTLRETGRPLTRSKLMKAMRRSRRVHPEWLMQEVLRALCEAERLWRVRDQGYSLPEWDVLLMPTPLRLVKAPEPTEYERIRAMRVAHFRGRA